MTTVANEILHTIIVGAGPAGLSAALILGRCRRRVVMFDTGRPRNGSSQAVHGFLTRDGVSPWELRDIGRSQLTPYDVTLLEVEAIDARRIADGFEVDTADGLRRKSRTLLLTTGLVDRLPQIHGFERFYGATAFHCPYCDGWESQDLPLAILARGTAGAKYALGLLNWSRSVTLCTDGPHELSPEELAKLDRNGIPIDERRIVAMEGEGDRLEQLTFETGAPVTAKRLFFKLGVNPASQLARRLGCRLPDDSHVQVGDLNQVDVEGLYVAGDATEDVKLAIIAAADGARAAFAINELLQERDQR